MLQIEASNRLSWASSLTAVVKGSRTPGTEGWLPLSRVAGVGEASGEETAGGARLGFVACSVYGELRMVCWSLSGRERY